MSNSRYVPWLSVTVLTGLCPNKLKILAAKVEIGLSKVYVRSQLAFDSRGAIAKRLRIWAERGLPQGVIDRLTDKSDRFPNAEDTLKHSAYWSQYHANLCMYKHKGHTNVVEFRDDRDGRLCQVCGNETENGKFVVCGVRRRSEQSNRTGYCHIECLDHLKIKEGEKVVRRELYINGPNQILSLLAWKPSTSSVQKVTRGAQLKRQQCINTGRQPTHIMWLNQSSCIEPVGFDIESVKHVPSRVKRSKEVR